MLKIPSKFISKCKNYVLIIEEDKLYAEARCIIDIKNNITYANTLSLGNIGRESELLMFTPEHCILGMSNLENLEYHIGINPNGNTVLNHKKHCEQNIERHKTIEFLKIN